MIRIVLKSDTTWDKSSYFPRDRLILLGTQGTINEISLTLAHEIGHAITVPSQSLSTWEVIESEIKAWEWAKSRLAHRWTKGASKFAIRSLRTYGIRAAPGIF